MILTYSVSGDTLNGAVANQKLTDEINALGITIALEGVTTAGDVLTVEFRDNISAGDETLVDGAVAAHDGNPGLDDPQRNIQTDFNGNQIGYNGLLDRFKIDIVGTLGDGKVSVSTNDTNADFLLEKLVAASTKLTFSIQNPGSDETYSVEVNAIDVSVGAADQDKLIKTRATGDIDGSLVTEANDRITIVGDGVPDVIFDSACPDFGGFCIKKSNASGFMNFMPNAETTQIIYASPNAATTVNRHFMDVDNQGELFINTLPGAGQTAPVTITSSAPLKPAADASSDLGTPTQRWNTVNAASFDGDGANITNIDSANISNFLAAVQANETTTSLSFDNPTKVLTYTDEDGGVTNVDLTQFLDDTNLARITSGSLDAGTGIATFTRDDLTTFTVDFSSLNDQAFINNAINTHEITIANHDDVTIASPMEGDILRYNGSQWVNFQTLFEFDVEEQGLINQSTTFAQYSRLNFTLDAISTIRVSFKFVWSLNTTGSDHVTQIQLDDTTTIFEQQIEPQDSGGTGIVLPVVGGGTTNTGTNQRFTKTGFDIVENVSAGAHFIDLDWRCTVTNTEATIYRAQLVVEKLI